MRFGKNSIRVGEPRCCCLACGRRLLTLESPTNVLHEKEEWYNLSTHKGWPSARSHMINAEDIESMYFHKRPWIWTCFYRAIVYRPHVDYISISGITQTYDTSLWGDPLHLPRDSRKARIGWQRVNPEAASCTPFWRADVLNPDNDKTAPIEQIGYLLHAHCWVLVDRVIGHGLVEANLKIFLVAAKQFWAENHGLWCRAPWKAVGYAADSDPEPYIDPDEWEDLPDSYEWLDPYTMPAWENPTIVPRIQQIIEEATLSPSMDSHLRGTISDIPLDIAIQIVEFSKMVNNITDTRNMLVAFGWRLPDSYWKSHYCRMDLIFDYADLQKTGHQVDWQIIGLATEELMKDPKWEHNLGLGTRRWIFQYLKQIKTTFLELIARDKTEPGCLDEPPRRKYPMRKRLL